MQAPKAIRNFTLGNAKFLSIKAGLATALAIFLSRLLGNPDLVSATFIAVMCCSPTLSLGLQSASSQYVGAFIGACAGGLMLVLSVPLIIGVPFAVALGIGVTFRLGFSRSFTGTAFTALFVQIVPFGGIVETLEIRGFAVSIAVISGLVIDILVSSLSYKSIFQKRLSRLEAYLDALYIFAGEHGAGKVKPGFRHLDELEFSLFKTAQELQWRRSKRTLREIQRMQAKVEEMGRLLHLVFGLSLHDARDPIDKERIRNFLKWVTNPRGEAPELSEVYAENRSCILSQIQRMH